jgi:hypothetical protein
VNPFLKSLRSPSVRLLMILGGGTGLVGFGCATSAPVKTQAYAELKTHRTFEYELPLVWKGIEASLKNHKITDRDPEEVDETGWPKLKERSLETDWIYSESRDKYVEYSINGSPRRKLLQIRYRYRILARKVMGGTEVQVRPQEEVEKVDPSTGSPKGYEEMSPDTARSAELLDRIQNGIFGEVGR